MRASDWDKVKNTVASCLDVPDSERRTLIAGLDTEALKAEALSLLAAYDEIARDNADFLGGPLIPGLVFEVPELECKISAVKQLTSSK